MSDEIHQLYGVCGWSLVALLDICGDLRGRCLTFGARRSSYQPATEQRLERFGQVSTDVVLFDVDLLEEGLVEQSPGLGVGGEVGRVAVAGVAECGSEILLDYFQVGPACFESAVNLGKLCGDAVLFGLHQVERHGSGVVGLEQLGTLVQQAFLPCGEFACGSLRSGSVLGEIVTEAGLHAFAEFGAEL
ncbi:hypothetical protein [Nocardia asiatica]|uniref:hypothetical protein n=1 Tax=Nocardia asiatica TaxID=209252 RepID=UPI0007C57D04|nr:hypothetical protein [Nocardia asiatica]